MRALPFPTPVIGAQVQVTEPDAAQLPDPKARIRQPGHDHPVPRRPHRVEHRRRGPVGQQPRMPARWRAVRQRVRRHRGGQMPEHRAVPVLPVHQPPGRQRRPQRLVHTLPGRQVQVVPLHAGGPDLLRALTERRCTPRCPQRSGELDAAQRHVTAQVPDPHRVLAVAVRREPTQMIHQVVRVGPLRALAEPGQEPLGPAMHHPGRDVQHDMGALPAAMIHDLNPQIVQRVRFHREPPHATTVSRTGIQRTVRHRPFGPLDVRGRHAGDEQ